MARSPGREGLDERDRAVRHRRASRWGAGPPLLLAGGVLLGLACWLRYCVSWLL
jgi:hypothetical protein